MEEEDNEKGIGFEKRSWSGENRKERNNTEENAPN